jgi:glyceraldehyde-3-phosphate dehydrogenase/erythrose-4-phosphate dehydrogenase
LQKQLEEFDAKSKNTTALANQRHQKLAQEYNAALAALDSQHSAFTEESKQKELSVHDEMIELEKRHQHQLSEIRAAMDQELNCSLEGLKNLSSNIEKR